MTIQSFSCSCVSCLFALHRQAHTRSVPLLIRSRTRMPALLRQNLFHHIPRHIRQSIVPSRVSERQLGVVEAQAVKNRGVEIVYVAFVLYRAEAEVVRLPLSHAALHTAAGQPT